ncbi:hypothetical protein NE237_014865 [Protea cynaroides]|uniref:Uncharacterized protein n=1 Tax=Protea cynaroides TaxID=273540 RepID=A0A9Q0KCZ1_9MAGN|nr:hypothetical protein NE237_014865 [Protea cynaroides]
MTVKWHDVCKPKKEGGLGIRWMSDVNKAHISKLVWNMMSALLGFYYEKTVPACQSVSALCFLDNHRTEELRFNHQASSFVIERVRIEASVFQVEAAKEEAHTIKENMKGPDDLQLQNKLK